MVQSKNKEVTCSGVLREKGSFLRNWAQYYFVLQEGFLNKYRAQKDNIPIDRIEINPKVVNAVTDGDGLSGKKFTLAIFITGKSPLILRAEKEEEKNEWLTKLKACLGAVEQAQDNDAAIVHTMESIVDACVITDDKAQVMGFNKAAEQLFGYTKNEILGKNVTLLMPLAYANVHDGYVNRYNRTGHKKLIGVPRQLIAKHKDGSTFPVIVSLGEVDKFKTGETKCAFVAVARPAAADLNHRKSSIQIDSLSAASAASASPVGMNNDDFLRLSQKKLADRLGEIVELMKNNIQEEYDDLEKNYIVLQHKVEILEQENKRLGAQVQQQAEDLKNLQSENAVLRKNSDKLSILEILRKSGTYIAFLNFCMDQHTGSEAVMFWKEAEEYRKKFGNSASVNFETEDMRKDAMNIYKKYFMPQSAIKVNVSAALSQYLEKTIEKPNSTMFLMAQDELVTQLNSTVFKEFIKTEKGAKALSEVVA